MYVFAESDCVLEVSLADATELSPGDTLAVDIHLEHNRLATATVPFAVWIEDESGSFVAGRVSEPLTIEYGNTLDHRVGLTLPDDIQPGRYLMRIGVEQMQRGLAWASVPFQVR